MGTYPLLSRWSRIYNSKFVDLTFRRSGGIFEPETYSKPPGYTGSLKTDDIIGAKPKYNGGPVDYGVAGRVSGVAQQKNADSGIFSGGVYDAESKHNV